MANLIERFIASINPDPSRETFYWDDRLKGFALRVFPSGRKVYFIQYRNEARRTRRFKIGTHSAMKAEAARSQAKTLLGKIEEGADPSAERYARRHAPTVSDLAKDYLERYGPKKRESSLRNDRSMLERTILPKLGRKPVAGVTRRDLEQLHLSLITTPYRANRVIALLSKMFNLAMGWEWRADNPVRGIERFQEHRRERWLNDDELTRLIAALDRHANQRAANAIRLLLLTGARRSEVLSATWDQFDFERGVWTKPSHHTKQNRTAYVPLSPPALDLLAEMQGSATDPSLFPGNIPGQSLQDIKKFWRAVCDDAGLEGVRIHDLRHTYASHLVSSGSSLPVVGKLLGHTQASTTQRYAHLSDDPLRDATNRFGEKLVRLRNFN